MDGGRILTQMAGGQPYHVNDDRPAHAVLPGRRHRLFDGCGEVTFVQVFHRRENFFAIHRVYLDSLTGFWVCGWLAGLLILHQWTGIFKHLF